MPSNEDLKKIMREHQWPLVLQIKTALGDKVRKCNPEIEEAFAKFLRNTKGVTSIFLMTVEGALFGNRIPTNPNEQKLSEVLRELLQQGINSWKEIRKDPFEQLFARMALGFLLIQPIKKNCYIIVLSNDKNMAGGFFIQLDSLIKDLVRILFDVDFNWKNKI